MRLNDSRFSTRTTKLRLKVQYLSVAHGAEAKRSIRVCWRDKDLCADQNQARKIWIVCLSTSGSVKRCRLSVRHLLISSNNHNVQSMQGLEYGSPKPDYRWMCSRCNPILTCISIRVMVHEAFFVDPSPQRNSILNVLPSHCVPYSLLILSLFPSTCWYILIITAKRMLRPTWMIPRFSVIITFLNI